MERAVQIFAVVCLAIGWALAFAPWWVRLLPT
jgi:hypothetical protein